jgi:hypothetical protein
VAGIRERSPAGDRTDIHVLDRWCHLGTADSEDRLWDILERPSPLPFDLDRYKILTRFLDRKGSKAEVLNLPRQQRAALRLAFGRHARFHAPLSPPWIPIRFSCEQVDLENRLTRSREERGEIQRPGPVRRQSNRCRVVFENKSHLLRVLRAFA